MRRRSGLTPAPIEFLPRRFFLVVVRERSTCSIHRAKDTDRDASYLASISERHLFPRAPGIHFVSLQEQLLPSTPSSSEFVLGIPQTIRFNSFLTGILSAATSSRLTDGPTLDVSTGAGASCEKVHYFFLRRRHLREEIQAIHLICRWRLLYLQLPPREALAPFEHLPYLFSSFLSSSDSLDPPNLLISLAGIAKGLEKELLGPINSTSGLLSPWDGIKARDEEDSKLWVVSQRFVVYSESSSDQADIGSGQKSIDAKQEEMLAELEYTVSALKRRKVSLVVTLSKTHCDTTTLSARGLEALEISSPTASATSTSVGDRLAQSDERLISRFLEACEGTEGLIAVNASSGSGCVSAVTCIGCYLMKHSNFTSQEAIGWLRFCLPEKMPMAWEMFLGQMQSQMWLEGDRFRRSREGHIPDEISGSPTSDSQHINIGKISLGRLSLLGTRNRDKHRTDPHGANIPVSACLSNRTQESLQSPTAATTTAQLKRRPLTQGSAGSRRYHRSSDGTSLRADFALMHKFLHQTPTTTTRSASSSTTSSSTATSSMHAVPSRPKASSRSPDGTPANCTEALA
ncbi:unnamed protein product [Phytophthora lilii]|uniref:Unnamed protein product n=1 Tax=Phytophthora lilii TaxID=2077276 RepID=A0A9W6TL09_9STRA|nr:unnamed protein product [Phytophthora lilii]